MKVMGIQTLPRYADATARWAAIALGFSIPISVALDNVLLVLVLAGWAAGGAYRDKWQLTRDNPVALAALGLFALLLLGTLYGEHYSGDSAAYLGKYSDLLFIPVFAFVFRNGTVRRRALYGLASSLVLILALSYLIQAGLLPKGLWVPGKPEYPVVFKQHLTHNILMAYGAFLFTHLAAAAPTRPIRMMWSALAVLALINVLVMVPGATGYLVLAALILFFGYTRIGGRGLAAAAVTAAALAALLAAMPGPFQQRVNAIAGELAGWKPGTASHTSAGLRLEFYRNTLAILADHPIIGVGTGGFPKAYADKVSGTGMVQTRNPHNEFLHLAVQIGLAGPVALLVLLYVQWRLAARLASPLERDSARGLVLAMMVGCMLNSLLLDHTEGLFYAWLTGVLYGGLKSGDG